MSTRSCIARLTGEHAFVGVYHHWDGYPTALGATLWNLYRNYFQRDLARMLSFLIDAHPAGWSTINGANFDLAPEYSDTRPCIHCGKEYVDHLEWPSGSGPGQGSGAIGTLALGHKYEYDHEARHPAQCYCHGERSEEPNPVDQDSDCGMEWAYVFDVDRRRLLVFERLYESSGSHMVGMFGMGAPGNQRWALAADIDLDGKEPNWSKINARTYARTHRARRTTRRKSHGNARTSPSPA